MQQPQTKSTNTDPNPNDESSPHIETISADASMEDLSRNQVRLSRRGANRDIRTSHQLPVSPSSSSKVTAREDEEYSSEDEEEGKPRRSTHINRNGVLGPVEMEGWLNKRGGHQHRFKNWKRRWFILCYPFLVYYEEPQTGGVDSQGANPLGSISMRGGCLVQEKINPRKGTKKVVHHRFLLVSDHKTYFLEASSAESATKWVNALNRSIYFANPAKRPGCGVQYEVKYAGEACTMKIEMGQIIIVNSTNQRKFHIYTQHITKVDHREAPDEIVIEYASGPDMPVGHARIRQYKIPLKTIRTCLEGVLQTRDNLKLLASKFGELS